jgi:hypothetical protein
MKKVSLVVSLIGMTLALVPACGKDKKAADPAPAAAPAATAPSAPPSGAAPAATPPAAAKKDDKGGW